MPSISDVYEQLVQANQSLQQLHSDLGTEKISIDAVKKAVDEVKNSVDNVKDSVDELVELQKYTNLVLVHLTRQEDTVICILEHISKNTCMLLNEANVQTGLQVSIQANTASLLELYQSVHPDAALESARLSQLRKQIEGCCPPEQPEILCAYRPCSAPEQIPSDSSQALIR